METELSEWETCILQCEQLSLNQDHGQALALAQGALLQGGWTPEQRLALEARELRAMVALQRDRQLVERVYAFLPRAQASGVRELQVYAHALLAMLQGRLRMAAMAMESAGRAEALLQPGDSPFLTHYVEAVICRVLFDAELFDELIERTEPRLADNALLHDPARSQFVHTWVVNLAAAHSHLSHYEEVVKWNLWLIQDSRRLGLVRRELSASVNLANALIWLQRFVEAEFHLSHAEQLAQQAPPNQEIEVLLLQNRALLTWKTGHPAEAMAFFHQARVLGERYQTWVILGRVFWRAAECAQECGDIEQALALRKAQVDLLQRKLKDRELSGGVGLSVVAEHAKAVAQNEYLREHGTALERELARSRDELEVKVQERTRELERATKLLVEQEKQAALSHMVVGVAHELNTPLGNAILATDAIGQAVTDHRKAFEENRLRRQDVTRLHESIDEGVQLALRNLERAAQLVRSFKALAIDRADTQAQRVRPADIVRNALAVTQAPLRQRGVTVHEGPWSEAFWTGDPGALGQVVMQLLENTLVHAFDPAVNPAPVLWVDARDDADAYRITVTDNGPGIEEHLRTRVFDPFFTTRLGQGSSGLGLHLVYRLVTQSLHGDIELQTSPQGHGLKVVLVFPWSRMASLDSGRASPA